MSLHKYCVAQCGWVLLLGAVCSLACKPSASNSSTKAVGHSESNNTGTTKLARDASDLFFECGQIPKIVLKLASDQEASLNEDARQYVKCTLVQDNNQTLTDVGLKLKGAAGSFQELSEKPAFTINLSKFRKQQSFHALEKFHLNNSVQDELYTNEWLCSSICRDAGVPAPRVTHARVWLNDRDLGLYVLKEGFDKKFLQRHFPKANGNLYDGGFCQDIDVDLEKDSGDGPRDFSDLHALKDACGEENPAQRKERISQHLDIHAFLSFMALETMTCHWDGYVSNRNNYRIYFPPESKLAHFLPHGMDQMFQDVGFQTFGETPAMVASSLRSVPEWNLRFRKRVEEMLPLFEGKRLADRVRSLHQKLQKEIKNLNPDGFGGYEQQVEEFANRMQERYEIIARQLTEPDPPPPDPSSDPSNENILELLGIALGETIAIADWEPHQETDGAQLQRLDPSENNSDTAVNTGNKVEASEPEVVYLISVGDAADSVASWRKRVLLPPGQYRFTAQLRVENVVERENDDRGRGAGIRISGTNRDNGLVGESPWSPIEFEFQTTEEQQSVQLVVELRAIQGSMAMKTPSLIPMARRSPP